MSKYKKLAENTVIFALGNVLSKLILSLLLPLYTRVLTTAEYGTAELITSYSQPIIPFASLSIGDALFRYSMDKKQDSRTVLTNSYIVLGVGTIFLLILVPLLKNINSIGEWSIYLVLICIFTMWRSGFPFWNTRIFSFSDNCKYSVDYFFNVCQQAFYIKLKNSVSGKLIKMMLIYSTPLIFNSISWGIMSTADQVMLKSMVNESENGIYAAAAKIPSLLSLLTGVFTQAWSLSVIQDYEDEKDNKFYENVFKMTHMGVVFRTLLMLFCNTVIKHFLSTDIAEIRILLFVWSEQNI